jgi:hypothetical protein
MIRVVIAGDQALMRAVHAFTTVAPSSQNPWRTARRFPASPDGAWWCRRSRACRHGYKCVALMIATQPDLGGQTSQQRQTSSDRRRPRATIVAAR